MEINENLEQPTIEHNSTELAQDGSMLGKFKDANKLLEAYNNLEAEFTRKSQKLSELQQECEKNAVFSYNDSLEEVLKNETDNDKYKKEIEEILAEDENISNLPNKNQVAFLILKNAERNLAKKLNSQELIDKCINDHGELYNKIIADYLSKLNNIPTSPKDLSNLGGQLYFSPNTTKPKNIKEAGEILFKMLK